MHHPVVKELTLKTIKELGTCQKIEIVEGVIDKLISEGHIAHLYPSERSIVHGLISLGWDCSQLKKAKLIGNNGKGGAYARWFPMEVSS